MTPGRNAVETAAIWSPYQAQQQRLTNAQHIEEEPLPDTGTPEEKE